MSDQIAGLSAIFDRKLFLLRSSKGCSKLGIMMYVTYQGRDKGAYGFSMQSIDRGIQIAH